MSQSVCQWMCASAVPVRAPLLCLWLVRLYRCDTIDYFSCLWSSVSSAIPLAVWFYIIYLVTSVVLALMRGLPFVTEYRKYRVLGNSRP